MRRLVLMTLGTLALVTRTAAADPIVTIEQPAHLSRVPAGSTQLIADGSVAFDEPAPSSRTLYLRQKCGQIAGTIGSVRTLTTDPGTDPAPCLTDLNDPYATTPLGDVNGSGWVDYNSVNTEDTPFEPLTLDASRPITGSITLASFPAGIGDTTVEVRAQMINVRSYAAPFTYSVSATDTTKTVPFSIPIPVSLDKKDVTGVILSMRVRGAHVGHGHVVHTEASSVTLPSWSASFERRVEVGIDDQEPTATGVELSAELDRWTARLPMPGKGDHTLSVRAVQGTRISFTELVSFSVG